MRATFYPSVPPTSKRGGGRRGLRCLPLRCPRADRLRTGKGLTLLARLPEMRMTLDGFSAELILLAWLPLQVGARLAVERRVVPGGRREHGHGGRAAVAQAVGRPGRCDDDLAGADRARGGIRLTVSSPAVTITTSSIGW